MKVWVLRMSFECDHTPSTIHETGFDSFQAARDYVATNWPEFQEVRPGAWNSGLQWVEVFAVDVEVR